MLSCHLPETKANQMLSFAATICGAVRYEELERRYFEQVGCVVVASGFAFYLLDPHTYLPKHTAVLGADRCFMKRYEDCGRKVDPLHATVLRSLKPSYSGDLFHLSEWKKHPIYRVFGEVGLDYVVEAPVLLHGQLVATIGFSRRESEGPFNPVDLATAEVISHFVGQSLAGTWTYARLTTDYEALLLRLQDCGSGLRGLTGLLTGREIEILRGVEQGLTNKEIARTLYISPHTVKTHLENIFQKLNVHSRAQLISQAYQAAGAQDAI